MANDNGSALHDVRNDDDAHNGNENKLFHPELQHLRTQLREIHAAMAAFPPLTTAPPILDSSADLDSADDAHWLRSEPVPGLRHLRDAVRRDLDVLTKFLDDPAAARRPALSTNAPYLIAVWHEVCAAPPPVVAVFRVVPPPATAATGSRQRAAQKAAGTKIDVVADGGRRWVHVNTTKNARLLAEFREIDSYLTDSDGEDGAPSLAPAEFDNSVLRVGRALRTAAETCPIANTGEVPAVVLRLTRLDPFAPGEDERIPRTVQALRELGVVVELGERGADEVAAVRKAVVNPPLVPTTCINLDLSILVALISDLTHSALPTSVDAANARFIPPQSYREWKKQRTSAPSTHPTDASTPSDEAGEDAPLDTGTHSRALTTQVLQEMRYGLLRDLKARLAATPAPEFWTTSEARDRCLRIVAKIGGPGEKRRAHALFAEGLSDGEREDAYWAGSRYPRGFVPLLRIRLHPLSDPPGSPDAVPLPPFFRALVTTCANILEQEVETPPPAPPGEIERAAVTRANARLTAHTVQSLRHGAARGWTTLTANRTSVRAILREVRAAGAGRGDGGERGGEVGGADARAAIWVVDPRSLAEGMRSDVEG